MSSKWLSNQDNMCLYNKLIQNPKYKANKKNGGNIPAIPDERVKSVPIGCGQCIECRQKKAREWNLRLQEEIREGKEAMFITLNFSNESIKLLSDIIDKKPGDKKLTDGWVKDNVIATTAVRYWLERWRKKFKKSLRHWLVTELGQNGTENIHIHGIVWTSKKNLEEIRKSWQYGYVWPRNENEAKQNFVNERTISYITKYVNKIDEKHRTYKSIILTSPGIGKNYTNRADSLKNQYNDNGETNETYRFRNGQKSKIPIYWRNKIYTEEQREKLWLQMLDKNERWVRGERIDISNGLDEYNKVVEWHRKINEEMGYGNDQKDEERQAYEREQRNLLRLTRINNAKNK